MRGIYFAFLISALISTSAPAEASGWELVFFDEFSGAALDRDKWATRYIYENETLDHFNDEVQRYRDNENHQLKDGVLALVAKQSTSSALFDSGMIRSHQTFYYGYFEARILLPSAIGVWPALWLHGDYSADGKVWYPPEIDIFEFVNNGVEDVPNMLHSGPGGEASDKWPVFVHKSPNFEPRYNTMINETPVSGSWHVVGFVWAPDRISLFWDGVHIYTREYQWRRSDGALAPPAHLILNFAVGGGWAGRHGIDAAAFPQALLVDYIRVCQHTAANKGLKQCGDSTVTPGPEWFGYEAEAGDMPRPAFLPAEVRSNGSNERLINIPFRLPSGFPQNRILEVSLRSMDNVSAPIRRQFPLSKEVQSRSMVSFSVPYSWQGPFDLTAIMRTSGNPSGDVPIPLACDSGVAQPVKSLACRISLSDR